MNQIKCIKKISFVFLLFSFVGCDPTFISVCCEDDNTLHGLPAVTLLKSYQASASGRDLPLEAKLQAARSAQNLFATGQHNQSVEWQTFKPDFKGQLTLIRLFKDKMIPCVEYHQILIFPAEKRIGTGTACVNFQGVWVILKELPDHNSKNDF